jgi:PhnB protein
MNFYKKCLGGKLTVQTIGDSPLAAKMPLQMKESVLQAVLKKDNLVLFASDMVAETGLIKGNSVSLMLNCNSEAEIIKYYSSLSAGGKATHPLVLNFEGALVGTLKDKFGNTWLLYFDEKQKIE